MGGGTDTNYPLLALTFAKMKQTWEPVPSFSDGDLLGHNIPANFSKAYYASLNQTAPSNCATSPDPTTVAPAMQQFMNNTVTFVATQIRAAVGKAPVIYAPGNIDTYGPGYGPDTTFLIGNAPAVYSQFLNSSVDQQAFLSTFTLDGYYWVERLGSKLLVIALNTNSFVGECPAVGSFCGAFLADSQLSSARAAGQKVSILMHVPPGANSQSIAQVASIPEDVDDNTVSMMWDRACKRRLCKPWPSIRGW